MMNKESKKFCWAYICDNYKKDCTKCKFYKSVRDINAR